MEPEINRKTVEQQLGEAVNWLREYEAKKDREEKSKGVAMPETREVLEKVQDAIDRAEDAKAQLRNLELKMARLEQIPGSQAVATGQPTAETKAYDDAMLTYLRKGMAGLSPEQHSLLGTKALSTDSTPDGGYVTTTTVERNVRLKLIEFDPIEELADSRTITGESWEGPAEGDQNFEAGWTAEREERGETGTGQLRLDKIPAEEMYAKPRITQKMLDDTGVDIEGWMTSRLVARFRVIKGQAHILGDGAGKSQGLLMHSGVTLVNSGHATEITSDGLIKLYYDLPEYYAVNSTWLLRRTSLRDVRLIKDLNGQYVWQPGLKDGQPSTILERPYRECPSMPAVAAGTKPIAFGDIRSAYLTINRQGIRTLRDPFSAKPFVEFYTTMRCGGAVVMPEALRILKIAA